MTRARHGGFTLTETLVAIGIVGFGLVSLLTLLPVGLRSTRLAGDFTTAAFIAQQELDEIRARAQVRDYIDTNGDGVHQTNEPYESGFDPDPASIPPNQRDNDGFGYYDLPFSIEKGTLTNISSPITENLESETFIIRMLTTGVPAGAQATFSVTSDRNGPMGSGIVGTQFTATDGRISFLIRDNKNLIFTAPNAEFEAVIATPSRSDTIHLKVQVINDVWYAYWAGREDYSEDRVLEDRDLTADGLDNDGDGNTDEADENDIDGVLTGLLVLDSDGIDNDHDGVTDEPGEMGIVEDTGLDLVPNFFDRNFNTVRDSDEDIGETGYAPGTLNDPHGDDGEAGVAGDPVTGGGTENNGAPPAGRLFADAYPDTQIQRVTVTVVWREGGRTRVSRFSTYVANRYL